MKKLILLAITTAGLMTMGSSCSDGEEPQQVDRMGRAAINTAVTDPFFVESATALHGQRQDNYNSSDNPADWNAQFGAQFRGNLAILDALNATPGDQLAADLASPRYSALTGVLTDDKLYVNTDAGDCNVYLAVEANATEIIPNGDCGGRKPNYDVVDVSYSVLANGSLGDVGDGVTDSGTSSDVFPFLGTPLTAMPSSTTDQ